MSNPYLQPIAALAARIAGFALLTVGAGLTAYLALALVDVATHEEARRSLTSSSVIFALILLVLCGFCWQAGYRLALNRPDRSGTLFSRPGWFALGTGLTGMAALMAYVIVAARPLTWTDVQVIASLAVFGAWCFVLACRRPRDRAGPGGCR